MSERSRFIVSWRKHAPWLALVSGGLLLAWGVRGVGGYPRCPNDEVAWAAILTELERGVDWPISGPLFVWLARLVAQLGDLPPSAALAVLGVLAVPLLLSLLFWADGRLAPLGRGWSLAALATTSYFWAPLLESRPQQWGQFLVLAGSVAFWQAWRGRLPWWPFVAAFLLTALFHLLSLAILFCCVLALWAFFVFVRRERGPATLAQPLLAMCCALLLVTMPGGPYQTSLADIREHHLLWRLSALSVVLGMLFLLALCPLWLLRQRVGRYLMRAWDGLVRRVLHELDVQPKRVLGSIAVLTLFFVLAQAWLLPAASWQPYHGSWGVFLVAQSGNLFFLAMLLGGLVEMRRLYITGKAHEQIEITLVLSTAMALLAFVALAGSLAMLHTNWMLRVINYALLVVAPLAALGLQRWVSGSRHPELRGLVALAFCGISLMATLRPAAVFDCALG